MFKLNSEFRLLRFLCKSKKDMVIFICVILFRRNSSKEMGLSREDRFNSRAQFSIHKVEKVEVGRYHNMLVQVQTFGLDTDIATDTAQKMVLLITTILFHV